VQAIILAGGFGTRLRSVIADVPKPMAPIHQKPFLAYLLDYLKSQGITDVVLSVHYLRDQIQDYFGDNYRGVSVSYAIEENALGTGGAIAYALKSIASSEPLFVLNGDTFLKLNYQAMYAQHQKNSPLITMALRKIADCSRYGTVEVKDNCVVGFKDQGGVHAGLINAGVYCLNPKIFENFSMPTQFSIEKDFLFPNAAALKPEAFIVDDYFIDIGIPEDYARAVDELASVTK